MEKINLAQAKANFSKIVSDVMFTGEPVVISKNGLDAVQISRIGYGSAAHQSPKRELGMLAGKATLPDDFDSMCNEEINSMFTGMF